jgi:hypothetical protein
MDKQELEKYELALRTQLAERRALWLILQEIVGRYASSFDDPNDALKTLSERVTFRMDRKEADAIAKGLELPLATVKGAVDRFFAELLERLEKEEL